MLNWISRCWGGMGITTNFQKARIHCTVADWVTPSSADIGMVISSFKGQNPQINPQTAFNTFLTHLEQDSEKSLNAFVLKNLLILDIAVDERVLLSKISAYYNNQIIFTNRSGGNAIKQLIIAYFLYIKEKAKNYEDQPYELIEQEERLKFLENSKTKSIIEEANRCFKIQNSILVISQKYQLGNKTPQLIQFIFSSLLKTYIFCYSIVSLGIKTLLQNLKSLNIHDLQQFSKLIKYYNKDYSHNFLVFLQQNKEISAFKDFKYNEIITIDEATFQIIEYQKQIISSPEKAINIKSLSGISQLIITEPENSFLDLESLRKYKKRKKFDYEKNITKNQKLKGNFEDYENFYCQNFFFGDEKIKMKKGKFMVNRSDSIYGTKRIIEEHDTEIPFKFDEQKWKKWQNINSKQQ